MRLLGPLGLVLFFFLGVVLLWFRPLTIYEDRLEDCCKILQSKHASFAFSQFKLFEELFFRKWTIEFSSLVCLKTLSFVIPCGVMRSVFIISAKSDASLYGVLVLSLSS